MTLDKTQMEILLREVVDKFLIPKFQSLGMNASGKWIDSLSVDFDGKSGFINGEDYTKYLVEGRPGGTMPPISALVSWVESKMGLSGADAQRMAWAVGMKIKKEGTNYYPNGTDLLEVLTSDEVTNYFNLRVSDMIVINTKIEFERIFKQALQ